MKTTKKCKLWLLSVFAIAFVSVFAAFIGVNVTVAHAEDSQTETTVFTMVDGVQLRLTEGGGIRFRVKMSTDVKNKISDSENVTLNFVIAPRVAFDAVNGDYAKLVKAAANTDGKAVARVMQADETKFYEEDGFYYSSIVISNVKEANRTLDMCAVAYINDNGANDFAGFNIATVRGNLYDVTNQAVLYSKEYAGKIFANTADYGWYGNGAYPIFVNTQAQSDSLTESVSGGIDFTDKKILVADSVTVADEVKNLVTEVTTANVDGLQEVVLGNATTYNISLGDYSSATVIKSSLGGVKVAYADGALTLKDEFKANTQKHGNQTFTAIVVKDGKYYSVNANILVVTKEITTLDELKDAVTLNEDFVKYGYYRLKNDLSTGKNEYISYGFVGNVGTTPIWKTSGAYGFRGTLDGGNHSITAQWNGTGLFGVLGNDAVVRDITLVHTNYQSSQMIFGYSMIGTTLENVTINVSGAGAANMPANAVGGLLTAIYSYSSELIDVKINAANTAIDTLFGNGKYYGYPTDYTKNTFENCVVNAKSLEGLACTDNGKGTMWTALNLDGITVKVDKTDVAADKDLTIGTDYEYDLGLSAISSVTLNGEVFSGYSFDNGTLIIKAEALGISDVGAKTFKITAKDEKGYLVEFNFTVTAKIVAEDVTLSGVKEVVLSDGTEYALDLGDYSSATVLSAVLGGDSVSYANGKLTLTNEFKKNAQKHGNNTLNLTVEKDGKYYNVTANVLVITGEITTLDELKSSLALSVKNNIKVRYGYYRLNNDLTDNGWYQSGYDGLAGLRTDPNAGFRGVFDGNNKTITTFFAEPGLFGIVGTGAVIKNLTISMSSWDSRFMAFGYGMIGATVENVTVNVKGDGITDIPTDKVSGLLTSIGAYGNTFKNLTINASNTNVDTLFGNCKYGYSYPTGAVNTFENCVVKAKSLIGLVCTDNANKTVLPYTNVNGLTVNLAA